MVVIGGLEAIQRLERAQQRHAAAGQDALFDRGAGGMQRIVDPVFLLLDLDFGRTADADHRDTAGKLGEPFLQLLAVIRSEEHTSELHSLMRTSYAVFCLKKKKPK